MTSPGQQAGTQPPQWGPSWAKVVAGFSMALAVLAVLAAMSFVIGAFRGDDFGVILVLGALILVMLAMAIGIPASRFIRRGGAAAFAVSTTATVACLGLVCFSALS